jgi:hypothetical protein
MKFIRMRLATLGLLAMSIQLFTLGATATAVCCARTDPHNAASHEPCPMHAEQDAACPMHHAKAAASTNRASVGTSLGTSHGTARRGPSVRCDCSSTTMIESLTGPTAVLTSRSDLPIDLSFAGDAAVGALGSISATPQHSTPPPRS